MTREDLSLYKRIYIINLLPFLYIDNIFSNL